MIISSMWLFAKGGKRKGWKVKIQLSINLIFDQINFQPQWKIKMIFYKSTILIKREYEKYEDFRISQCRGQFN